MSGKTSGKRVPNSDKGKKFSSEYQPAKNGRPKNVFKQYHNLFECSRQDVEAVFTELLSKSVEELAQIRNDKSTVALRSVIAATLIDNKKSGSLYGVGFLIDRLFGSVVQKVESSISINTDDEKVAAILAEYGISKSKN